MMTQGLTNI